jgi:hypothetical protein
MSIKLDIFTTRKVHRHGQKRIVVCHHVMHTKDTHNAVAVAIRRDHIVTTDVPNDSEHCGRVNAEMQLEMEGGLLLLGVRLA